MNKRMFLSSGVAVLALSGVLGTKAAEITPKVSENLHKQILLAVDQKPITVFVYFKDKGENIDQKLALAESSLTPEALQRRIVNRGVGNVVSEKDIPIEQGYIDEVLSYSQKLRHKIKALNVISVEAMPEAIKAIANLEYVEKIDLVRTMKRAPVPDERNEVKEKAVPTNSKKSQMAMLRYGASYAQNEVARIPEVHNSGLSGNGIIIAVFDSGFNRLTHDSLASRNIAGTWDFVNGDSDVGDSDDIGVGNHGTKTLSMLGGYRPGKLIGPAYGATFYLAKTENNESETQVEEDNWCAAVEWAETNGAHIISSSLGYRFFDDGSGYSSAEMDGDTAVVTICADAAAENGVIVVNSAGNEGGGSGQNTIGAPSDGNFVLAVGAVDSNMNKAGFSSVGPSADGRVKPDVAAFGVSAVLASPDGDDVYTTGSGTSFACPQASGVAALVLEANLNLTAAEVRDILRNTARNASTPDNLLGYGVIDAVAAVMAAGGKINPVASFEANTTNGSLTVNFINNSYDSDGQLVSYSWDFGDGNGSSEENPSNTFASDGTYTVTLTVTDNDGFSDVLESEVTVSSVTTPNPGNNASSSSGGGVFDWFFTMLFIPLVYRATSSLRK